MAVWYLSEVWRCSRFTPTCDTLFDTYARALIRCQRWRLFHEDRHHAAVLPDAVIARWEHEFGADPRYWQLRYWNTLQSLGPMEHDYGRIEAVHRRATAFLQRARDTGIADGGILAALYAETCPGYARDAEGGTVPDWVNAAPLARLRREWSGADPQSAWPYYTAALQYLEGKHYPAALTELRKGDAAPNKRFPGCFPLSFVRDRLTHESPGMGTDNPVLFGAIISGEEPASCSAYATIHGDSGEFEEWLGQRRDAAGLAALYRMGCAMGRSRRGMYSDILGGLILMRRSAYSFLESFGGDLSAGQRKLVLAAIDRGQRLAVNTAYLMNVVIAQQRYFDDWNIVDVVAVWEPVEPSPLESFPAAYARHLWLLNTPDGMRLRASLAAVQYCNHKSYTWGEFRQLAEIDFTDLNLPKDWMDIGAKVSGMPELHPQSKYARQAAGAQP